MQNPFQLYSIKLLHSLINNGHKYYVRQTYPRGKSLNDKAAFLITYYNNLNQAQIHFDAISKDGNRFLYDVTNPEHYKKLEIAAGQPDGLPVYAPLLKEVWKPTERLAGKIKRYIDSNLDWRPSRKESVNADLFTQWGELYISLRYQSHEVKVPLTDIEKTM